MSRAHIAIACGVAEVIRPTFGPRGLDKLMFCKETGKIIITNDGATILSSMEVLRRGNVYVMTPTLADNAPSCPISRRPQ